jgi:hypothetical protein
MGKDREGRFHPAKGKPSDDAKEGLGSPSTLNADDLKQDEEMTEKYTEESDRRTPGVPRVPGMKHPNRNTSKDEDYKKVNGNKSAQSNKSVTQTFTEERSDTEPEELPGILYKSLFEQLANFSADCCISAYLPTHRAGMQVNEQQDRLAFKNVLQQVRSMLHDKGYTQTEIEKITEPGYKLLRENDIWRNMANGLAVFMSRDYFKYIRLTIAPPKEEILINESFYLRPLVPAMADTSNEYFYVLLISKRKATFFRADAFYMEEIVIEELPRGVDDVVHFEEKDDQKLFRMGDSGTGVANFHGIGAGKPDEKENLALYMKEVDRVLWQKVLGREQAPLLLAGIDYLIPIYKSVSAYQYIRDEALIGNFEHHSALMLYQAAREKMQPFFDKHHKTALEAYYNKLATPLTSSMPESVIPACYYGKVSDLFVEKDTHLWGTFDAQNNQLQLHATHNDGDDCMIDKAVIQTILHGGQVHLLDKDQMPKGSTIAALMRY